MLTLQDVSEFVYRHCEKVTEHEGGNRFHARCPICGDSKKSEYKKRFHVTFDGKSAVYHCFNCEASGNFYSLVSLLDHIAEEDAYRRYNSYDAKHLQLVLTSEKTNKIEEKEEKDSEDFGWVFKDCIFAWSNLEGYFQKLLFSKMKKFVMERKIEIPIAVAYKGKFRGRFIIPVIENKKLIYFQGRAAIEGISPKYLNPVSEKQNIIVNKEKFEKDKYIIITEGLLDAYSVGNQGTACLGKSINDDFIKKVKKYTEKGIIIALDNDKDGFKQLHKIIEKSEYNERVRYFLMPKHINTVKDLNELKAKKDIEDIYNFVVENSYSKLETVCRLIK